MKITAIVIAAFIGVFTLGWIATANDWALAKVWMPKMEQVRYDTFKQSQAYNEGMLQELESYRLDYAKADKDGKAAIRSIILHRYAAYDTTKLPPDLYAFVSNLQSQP